VPYNPDEGFNRIMPGVRYTDVDAALGWLARVFGLTEHLRWTDPETRKVRHAEMRYGENAFIELSDGGEGGLLVIVDDVEAHFRNAKAAGAEIVSEPEDKPWGLRHYRVKDLEGNAWEFAQHVRDVPPSEWGAELAT
jgi:uncharacterized glyoxalase superfamily protein PhnB